MNFIFVYGPPAAGKLTVATELSKKLDYKLLDNHKAIDYLAELFPRSDNQELEQARSHLGRKIRLDMFEAVANAGVDLITTFAPLSPGTLDFMRQARDVVEKAGGKALFVQLLPSQDVLLDRVTGSSRLGKKIDSHKRWHEIVGSNAAAFETFPDTSHCVLDNSALSPEEAAQKIIEYYGL
jgi:adenylylsulfate kinase-like enzyme